MNSLEKIDCEIPFRLAERPILLELEEHINPGRAEVIQKRIVFRDLNCRRPRASLFDRIATAPLHSLCGEPLFELRTRRPRFELRRKPLARRVGAGIYPLQAKMLFQQNSADRRSDGHHPYAETSQR